MPRFFGPIIQPAVQRLKVQQLSDYLQIPVERAFMQDLDTAETMTFLLNPTELEEIYSARYARLSPPGLSHQRLQYTGGNNTRIPMSVYFDQVMTDQSVGRAQVFGGILKADSDEVDDVEKWRRFLISLVTPRRAKRLSGASPSPILFSWPGMIDMRVRLMSVRFRHILFRSGQPKARAYVAEIQLEEAPLERFFASDVRRVGTHRPWSSRLR